MPNSIKYSTTGDTLSLRKGNLYFGTGDVGKGPSSVTQHYNGVTPNGGGYTIYFYDPRQPNNIGYDPISSDVQLIRYTNGISGQNFTGATQCFNWYATQTNYTCVNEDYDSIITNGLVLNLDAGFLPSYPTSGTTWYDLSYSGNNGTLTNGPTYSSLDGGSIVFDGVNDTVSFPAITLGSTYTITQTLVASASNNNIGYMPIGGGIVSSGSTYTGYVWFTTNPAGSTTSIVFNQNGETGGFSFTLPTPLPQYTLFQYTLVKNSSTANFYINGTLLTTQSVSSGTNFTVRNLGWSYSSYYMNRNLYSTQIYNRALSAAEILKNYNAGLARFNTPNIVKSNLLLNLDSSNTVSYPTSGTTWTDLSGNGYHSILTNGPTFNSTSKSIVFDGTNDYAQYSARTPNTEFQYYDAFTVEALTYVNESTSNTGFIITNRASRDGNNTEYTGWGLAQYNSSIRGSIGGYPSNVLDWRFVEVTGTTFTDQVFQKWSHIVWVNTGVAGQQKIYINGVDRTNNSGDDATPPYTINYNNGTHRITVGMSPADGTPGGHFLDGSIELTRVYNKALSQSEVLQNFYGGPIVTNGLVMYLDAGNLVSYSGAGTTWYDLTTNGNNATFYNGVGFSSTNGGGIVFDGVDDYAVVLANSSLNSSQPTIELFMTTTTNGGNIIAQGQYGSNWGYGVGVKSGSILARNNGGDSNFSVSNSGLVHVVVVYDGSGNQFYKNGVFLGRTTTNYSPNPGGQVTIGGVRSQVPSQNLQEFANSTVSVVRIYNRALTADEISQNYNAQKSRFGL